MLFEVYASVTCGSTKIHGNVNARLSLQRICVLRILLFRFTFGFMPPTASNHTITFSTELKCFQGELWKHFIVVPAEIAVQFIEENDRRVICTLDERVSFHSALMHDGEGGFFITVNAARLKQIKKKEGDRLSVSLIKDRSEYGVPVSEELLEVLEQFPVAKSYFETMKPGVRRTLIQYSDQVKSPDIRIRRAMVVCRHLEKYRGQVSFRQLGEEIKEANNRERR